MTSKTNVDALFDRAEKALKEFSDSPNVQEQDIANGILRLARAQRAAFEHICDRLTTIERAAKKK